MFLHFTCARLRQRLHHKSPWNHVGNHVGFAPRVDFLLSKVLARIQFQKGTWRLSPLRIIPSHDSGSCNLGVFVQNAFHLQGRDVLTSRNNDILRAILQLDVAVRVPNCQISGVKPTSLEGVACSGWILQVTLHDQVAPEENLAHSLAVSWNRLQRLCICNHESLLSQVPDTLPCFEFCLLLHRQLVPLRFPLANCRWAEHFCEAIDMCHVDAQFLHGCQDWSRWRRGRCHHLQRMLPLFSPFIGKQGLHDYRSTAEVRNTMLCN
mmetsp:Transcript_68116/g.134433  ORF Transcript_68116/g.134433 Transcript_68116/m.134433 type:complete len:265 (+) Transcript_68116:338-1132(+)